MNKITAVLLATLKQAKSDLNYNNDDWPILWVASNDFLE